MILFIPFSYVNVFNEYGLRLVLEQCLQVFSIMTIKYTDIITQLIIFQESISTCRFAQRVAMIKNDALLNEEVDPKLVGSAVYNSNGPECIC